MTINRQNKIDANEVQELHDSIDGLGSLFQLEFGPSLHPNICGGIYFCENGEEANIRYRKQYL